MSGLLKKIQGHSREAARALERARLCNDEDIQALTPEELRDLLPGAENIKLRRDIYEIINTKRPLDVLLRDLKGFIPHESFRAALTNNGVLVDYLYILKDMKTQVDRVQGFLDAHIRLLEDLSKEEQDKGSEKSSSSGRISPRVSLDKPVPTNSQPDVYSQSCQESLTGAGTSHSGGAVAPYPGPSSIQSGVAQVIYKKVVSGKTFNADEELMKKVKDQKYRMDRAHFIESQMDHKVIVLFCPISSRIGADVEAAMSDVKEDGKQVILVLMHHAREAKHTTNMRTWSEHPQVVLHAHVFYHETVPGLLSCPQNNDAASKIRDKLLEYSSVIPQYGSGNAQGMSAGGRRTDSPSATGRGDSNVKGSTSFFGLFNR